MATILRPRLPSPAFSFLYPPKCHAALHRSFSTTRTSFARLSQRGALERDARRSMETRVHREQPSPKMLAKAGLALFQGRDFGLLPDTFIMPTGSNKPSLTRWPRARLRLEWVRLQRRVKDLFYVLAAKWAIIKPRPKLRTGRVPRIAQALQTRMYTAFAEGNESDIQEVCCDGLAQTFLSRLRSRSPREHWTWRLVRYRGRPRVVSHKIAAVPTGEKGKFVAIRQAVVRIRSQQSLAKSNVEPAPRDITEYFVLQQSSMPGNPLMSDWKVWGTLEEDKDLWKKYI